MFHPMRRKNQQLPMEAVRHLLETCTNGVLALQGDEPYPYAVPLSYVYIPPEEGDAHQGTLYFHCAGRGHKLEAIRHNPRASFAVVGQDEIRPEKYTTHYRSAIAFGEVAVVDTEAEKLASIRLLGQRYHPTGTEAALSEEIKRGWKGFLMLRFTIHHLTGKESRELAVRRQAEMP